MTITIITTTATTTVTDASTFTPPNIIIKIIYYNQSTDTKNGRYVTLLKFTFFFKL